MLWGEIAAYAVQHVRKGNKLYAEGKLQYRSYTIPEQGRKTVAEILIDQVFSLEKKKPAIEKYTSKEGEFSDLPR
jgi:single-stranded DNA-binding protein